MKNKVKILVYSLLILLFSLTNTVEAAELSQTRTINGIALNCNSGIGTEMTGNEVSNFTGMSVQVRTDRDLPGGMHARLYVVSGGSQVLIGDYYTSPMQSNILNIFSVLINNNLSYLRGAVSNSQITLYLEDAVNPSSSFMAVNLQLISYYSYSGVDSAVREIPSMSSGIEAAKTAAQGAQTAADSALLGVNYIRNNMLSTSAGIVQDASGTVLAEARAAKTNSVTTNSLLNNATYGLSALKTNSNTTNNLLNNGTYGLSALNTKISNLDADNTNIQNDITTIKNNIGPIIFSVKGKNGATCTNSGKFNVIINASGANQYRAWIDGGSDSGFCASNDIMLSGIIGTGAKTIKVQAKSNTGIVAESSMSIYSLQNY